MDFTEFDIPVKDYSENPINIQTIICQIMQ